MPTMLGEPYSPTWRGKYPHMLQEDYPIWELFLTKHTTLFERVYYDVRVGGVMSEDPTISEKDKLMFYNVTAKRVDVVAELKEEVWIIEVASHPGLRAMGQVMTYFTLWYKEPKIDKPAKAVLVANVVDADLMEAMRINGVLVRLTI